MRTLRLTQRPRFALGLRLTQRRVATISACLGISLVMTGATLTWVNLKAADAHRATAVQANDAIANDMTSSATALIHQDYDLLRTLTRDPSFSDWQALSGSNDLKLSEQSGRAATMRDDWKQIFLDYDALFPNSFRRLELVDTNNNQPLAILSDGQWVDTAKLPRTIDKSEEGWFTVVSYLVNTALVTEPYTDGTGERVISVAAPLLGAGSHGAVVATFPLSQFDTATVVSGTALTNVAGVVDLTDGSVLSTGKDQYAVTPAMTADAVKRVKHAGGKSVHFVLNGKAYSVIAPVDPFSVNAKLTWLGVISVRSLPASGLSAALNPVIVGLVLAGLALLLLSLFLAWRLRGVRAVAARHLRAERDRFAQGMSDLTSALERTSTGDLATRLNVELGDEAMSGLAASFDQTLASLRDLVASAQANSSLLNAAATELRASSTQQASSANQQSAVVTETTATIEELAATAVQIAENSEAVAAVAEQTLATTIEGRNAVEESVAAIEAINTQVGFIASACEGLGDKISEIGGILAIIDELSDQTNLLALNAAIEAARAGEHGRGFAVVATEIRRLAERSQESTVRIQSIITEVSSRARQTVDASAQGSQAVHAVTEQARAAAHSLDRIAALVDSTTSAAREISAATGQQRSASEQVVQAMAEVSASARQFAAGAKQSASSAQEIADLAVRTELSISHFVTEQEELV